jgi:RNA polymerase sigma factor CnrH
VRERARAAGRAAELYARHARMVYGLCRLLLRDPVEAEDAAQQTFLAAYGALLRGGRPRDSGPWLAAIARNECRRRLHARADAPFLGVPELMGAESLEAQVERRLWVEELARELGELPGRQREVVVLRDVYGLRASEIAAALGLSRPAVESLLFRARRRLRVRLRPAASALTLPVTLRDALAEALPGFSVEAAGVGAAGAAGGGLMTKLASAPLAAKLTAGAVAAGTAGSVAISGAEHRMPKPPVRPSAADADLRQTPARAFPSAAAISEHSGGRRRAGGGDESDDHDSASSGPGSGREDRRRVDRDRSGRGDGLAGGGESDPGPSHDLEDGTSSGPGPGGGVEEESESGSGREIPQRSRSGPSSVASEDRSSLIGSSGTSGSGTSGSGSSSASHGSDGVDRSEGGGPGSSEPEPEGGESGSGGGDP